MKLEISSINEFDWVDSYFNGLKTNSTDIIIEITIILPTEENSFSGDWNKSSLSLICKNYASIKCIGRWDENVVASITTYDKTEFIEITLLTIKNNNFFEDNTYNDPYWKSIDGPWVQLTIKLIDGVEIDIVCQSIEIVQEEDSI